LTLSGLGAPFELAGCVLQLMAGQELLEAVLEARQLAGEKVILDGPEYTLAQHGADVDRMLHQLDLGLHATGLAAVLNLNSNRPPPWALALAPGPLFGAVPSAPDTQRIAALADTLVEGIAQAGQLRGRVRVHWHLAEPDLRNGDARLLRLARLALGGVLVDFVFDRDARPVSLAEGIDRLHPATLLTVGLNLPALAEQLSSHP